MTRPKVPADQRIRTAQACESCKRRKQKCNGVKPCTTCQKRGLTCEYTASGNPRDDSPQSTSPPAKKTRSLELPSPAAPEPATHLQRAPLVGTASSGSKIRQAGVVEKPRVVFDTKYLPEKESERGENELESHSRNSVVSGPDEETTLLQSTRMLQDPTGRILYVGDSASLAYLQLIRMIVETRTGPNDFTMDPNRLKIMEATINIPPGTKPLVLPDRGLADVLVKSFFVNTRGLIEVFNNGDFWRSMDKCYEDPLHAPPSFLCLLFLTFAIGTVLATPGPGTQEDAHFRKLRNDSNTAEIFFMNARSLGDPVSGFEDADFWSVQALSLMAVYRLAVSKRNAASALLGMAVRSAFALGLHRVQENYEIFSSDDVKLRRNLWRSLFVLDRIVAASLGRPAVIPEDECSEDALNVFGKNAAGELIPAEDVDSGLGAAVRSCQVIGQILKRIYAPRRISLHLAHEMAEHCRSWYNSLPPSLSSQQVRTRAMAFGHDPSPNIAALHVNLLYAHAVILLTRPFFICLLSKVHNERSGHKLPVPRWLNRMSKYCDACFTASNHTIYLVHCAFESQFLPRKNPFVLYFLFAACLIILSNEFGAVYHNPSYNDFIEKSIVIMRHCSEADPQAKRLLYVLTSFRSAVAGIRFNGDSSAHPTPGVGANDPMANLFAPSKPTRRSSSTPAWQLSQKIGASSSLPPCLPPESSAAARASAGTGTGPPNGYRPGSLAGPSGVSPASSAAASGSARDPDLSDSVGEGELHFDNLMAPFNLTSSHGVQGVQGVGVVEATTSGSSASRQGVYQPEIGATGSLASPTPTQSFPMYNWQGSANTPVSCYGMSVPDEMAGGSVGPTVPATGGGPTSTRSWSCASMPADAPFFSAS